MWMTFTAHYYFILGVQHYKRTVVYCCNISAINLNNFTDFEIARYHTSKYFKDYVCLLQAHCQTSYTKLNHVTMNSIHDYDYCASGLQYYRSDQTDGGL